MRGLSGLRIVDGSILPYIPTANVNAPIIMVAEKIADRIRGRQPLAHRRLSASSLPIIVGRPIRGIAADLTVPSDLPDIAQASDRRTGLRFRNIVGRVRLFHTDTTDQRIDLRKFEPGQDQIEVKIEIGQVFELDSQQLPVPAGVLRLPVVGDDICPDIGLAHITTAQCRNFGHTEAFRGLDPAAPL